MTKPEWVLDGRGDYWHRQPDGRYKMRLGGYTTTLERVEEYYGIRERG